MNPHLDISEQILLSAWIDGEVSDAERAQMQSLLQRPEARAYLEQLQAARILVNKHGAQKAPVGLKGRVLAALDEDFDDISRPTASREGNVIAMPTASWKTPLMALAAAVVIVLGLVFGPALFPTTPEATPADIARETANRKAQDKGGDVLVLKEKPEGTFAEDPAAPNASTMEELRNVHDKLKENERAAGKPEGTEAERFARNRNQNGTPDDTDRSNAPNLGGGGGSKKPSTRGGEEAKLEGKTDGTRLDDANEDTADEAAEKVADNKKAKGTESDSTGGMQPPAPAPMAPSAEAEKSKDTQEDKPADSAPRPAHNEPPKAEAAKEPSKAGVARKVNETPAEAEKQNDPEKEFGDGKSQPGQGGTRDAESGAEGRAEGAGDERRKEESPQGDDNWGGKNDTGPGNQAIATTNIGLALKPGRALAAQNDLLRVAALYGKAGLSETEAGDSIEVDLDEDRLAELVAALQRISEQQDYGAVSVPARFRQTAGRVAQPASDTARDTLPSDVKVQVSGEVKDATTAKPAELAKPAAKVRLVISLN